MNETNAPATKFQTIRGEARAYYTGKVRANGATPRGVDWNSADSQEMRGEEKIGEVAADETGDAGDKNLHFRPAATVIGHCINLARAGP